MNSIFEFDKLSVPYQLSDDIMLRNTGYCPPITFELIIDVQYLKDLFN